MADPPYWAIIDPLVGQGGGFTYGFAERSTAAQVNRFRARYRFAAGFQGLRLDGYLDDTRMGYEALTSLTLWWSCLELLAVISGVSWPGGLVTDGGEPYLTDIRAIFGCAEFIRVAERHLTDNKLRKEIISFLDGRQCAPLAIARAIRHIFLHGPLTPGAGGGDAATAVCIRTRDYLRVVVDESWTRQIGATVTTALAKRNELF